jgi:transposase InsO family protein
MTARNGADAAVNRPAYARVLRDAELRAEITRVYENNYDVYRAGKLWLQLLREKVDVGRDRVARLMRDLGLYRRLNPNQKVSIKLRAIHLCRTWDSGRTRN